MRTAILCIAAWIIGSGIGHADSRGIIPDSHIILRNEEELLSLKAVVADATAWPILRSLSSRYAVWKIISAPVDSTEGDGGATKDPPGRVFRHTFEFASRRRVTTKTYRVAFECSEDPEGKFTVRLVSSHFARLDSVEPDTVFLRGRSQADVFRGLLLSEAVGRRLAPCLPDCIVTSLTIERVWKREEIWEYRTYRVAFGVEDEETEKTTYVQFEVLYDARSGKLREIRLIDG